MFPARRYELEYPVYLAQRKQDALSRQSSTLLGTDRYQGSTLNLSETGLAIRLMDKAPIEPGDQVVLAVRLGESTRGPEAVTLQAHVIWRKNNIFGLKIGKMAMESHYTYRHLLEGFQVLQDFSPIGQLHRN